MRLAEFPCTQINIYWYRKYCPDISCCEHTALWHVPLKHRCGCPTSRRSVEVAARSHTCRGSRSASSRLDSSLALPTGESRFCRRSVFLQTG